MEELGLRERKKREAREAIARAAFELFAARGFDAVTVAEVAAAAGTSVQTVFNYFPVKEDLVLGGRKRQEAELLRAVAERPAGTSAIVAVHQRVLRAAEEFRQLAPDRRERFRTIVGQTPSILARLRSHSMETEIELARLLAAATDAKPGDPRPRLVASFLISLSHLAYLPGDGNETARIDAAFELLSGGLADYAIQPERPAGV